MFATAIIQTTRHFVLFLRSMVRIGRQIPHFEEVDVASIDAVFSQDRRFRYLLELQYKPSLYSGGRKKRACVILKNPSSADATAADATIRKVETYVYNRLEDVRQLSILNLFALRATDATDVNQEFLRVGAAEVIGPGNDVAIRQAVEQSDYLIVAWGNRSGINAELYGERIGQVKRLIAGTGQKQVFKVVGPRPNVQPLHGLMWGYDYSMEAYLNLKES